MVGIEYGKRRIGQMFDDADLIQRHDLRHSHADERQADDEATRLQFGRLTFAQLAR